MATVFQNILANAERKGIVNQKSEESIEWFRKNARKTAVDPSRVIREERANLVNSWTNVGYGKMYMVYYDPKWKKELPYYDTFPLIIPFSKDSRSIKALNLHYLPPVLRAKLLDGLFEITNNDRFDETTKMKISYGLLKSASSLKYYKPCVKMYIGSHFRSRFVRIPPANWAPACFLPLETFQKASKKQVWADSRKMIK